MSNEAGARQKRRDVQKKIDQLLFRQRLKRLALVALGVLALGAVGVFVLYEETVSVDRVVQVREVEGTVVSARRVATRRGGFQLYVQLDEGKSVRAVSRLAQVPYAGERARLAEIRRKSGITNYVVRQLYP